MFVSFKHTVRLGSISLLFCMPLALYGQEPTPSNDPIDVAMEKAMSGNTIEIASAVENAEKAWDKELKRLFQQALIKAPNAQRTQLRNTQKAWLAFREADFASAKQIVKWRGRDGGTIWSGVLSRYRMSVIRDRVWCLRELMGKHKPEYRMKDPIDKIADEGDTIQSQIQALVRAKTAWGKEMNKVLQSLNAELPAEQKTVLSAAQKAWMAYRDADLKLVTGWYDRSQGAMKTGIAERHIVETVKDRAWNLRDLSPLGN